MTTRSDLPPWGIVFEAWRVLVANTGTALRLAVLPFLILLAMHRLVAMAEPAGLQAIGLQLLYVVVFPVPISLLLVPWYRLILSAQRPELADRPAAWWYVSFMLRTLGLVLMLFAFHAPSTIFGILALQDGGTPDPELGRLTAISLVLLAPGFYLYGRAALALPGAASGDDDSYGRSWRTTAGAGWRIAGIVFVLWFTFVVITALASGAAPEDALRPGILGSVVSAAIDVARELAMAAGLALVYLHYGARKS